MPSLAAALKDFGAPRFAVADVFDEPHCLAEPPRFSPPEPVRQPAPAPVDVEALVADAVAQAEAVLSERFAQEYDEALRLERERHSQEMAEIQARFAEEAGASIRSGLEEMELRVVELTSAVTARILGGVLTDDVRQRSINRLAGIIRDAIADDDAVRIRVRGSLPLYEELKSRLPKQTGQLDFSESPNFDLSVTIDDSMFETRLAEWSAALAEALS